MRLTLRTMLAYLDDVLEPSDGKDIGKKVEESKFATDLSHRIRGCVQRLKLPAPKLEGSGIGLDANTVSEYLDSTLPDDKVPDFEKVCLDSDVHLAEAASCHQILTLVLGELAHVDQLSRERMYRIGQQVLQEGTQTAVNDPAEATVASPRASDVSGMKADVSGQLVSEKEITKRPHHKPEIPEYLRDNPKRRWWAVAATVLATAVLTVGMMRLMGPLDDTHRVYLALSRAGSNEKSTPVSEEGFSNELTSNGDDVDSQPRLQVDDEGRSEDTVERPIDDEVVHNGNSRYTEESTPDAVETPDSSPKESFVGNVRDATDSDATSDAVVATLEGVGEVESAQEPLTLVDPAPVGPLDLGRYLSDDRVLARLDHDTNSWHRLAPLTAIFSKDVLLALPTFRSQIMLASGIQLTLTGGTLVRLDASAPDTPHITVDYGRCLLVPVAKSDAKIMLHLAGRQLEVAFVDNESALAIEVHRFHTPGSNPREVRAHELVRLIPTTGGIDLRLGDNPPNRIMVGKSFRFLDDEKDSTIFDESFPTWIHGDDLETINRLASRGLAPEIVLDRSISLTLAEQSESARRLEIRALAARCLTYLGEFEQSIRAIDDPDHHSFWTSHFMALKDGLARDRETANHIAAELDKHRGQDAEQLFRLLYGYSPQQLNSEGAVELVNYLDYDKLDIRVLALENLRKITGKTLSYRPQHPPKKRKTFVRSWRNRLGKNFIEYKSPPLDIPPRGDSTTESQTEL